MRSDASPRMSEPAQSNPPEARKPSRGFRRALKLWESGDYERCLIALGESPSTPQSSEAILLRARVLIRAQRYDDAQNWLNENLLRHHTRDALATHALLMGTARSCNGDFVGADEWFAQARSHRPHRSILAETDYQQALARYQADALASARRIVAGALRPVEDIIYVRARSLLGWIATAEGDYKGAYREFTTALEALDGCRSRDQYLAATLVYALSILSAECGLGDPHPLDQRCRAIEWTSSTLSMHVQTLRHIGLAHARCGDGRRAVQHFMSMAATAEGTGWAILGFAECATVLLRTGEPLGAHALAARAAAIADQIDAVCGWNGIDGEQRLALLVLAELSARLNDGARARHYRERYGESRWSALSALRHDMRLATFERHVDALVLGANGEPERARLQLVTVAHEWERIGYRARASEARADAARLDPSAPPVPEPPTAFAAGNDRAGLSLRDERVARMVAHGKSDPEIASELGVARRTARNIVHGLFPKFDVHTRAQLIVAVTERRA